jgi:hypothetical protein
MGAGSSPIPAAARMSAGPALVAASAAIAIAIPAAAGVACGGTTSRTTRFWPALVTPIVSASCRRHMGVLVAAVMSLTPLLGSQGCGQAARAGVGCGLGSGSGIGRISAGAPDRLADRSEWRPGWLLAPLSQ